MSSTRTTTIRAWLPHVVIWGAVILFGIWIARNTYWTEITLPTDLRGDAATNDWYVLEHLAQTLQVKITKIDSVDSLPPQPAMHQAVVYVHNWNWGVLPERQEKLRRWTEQGGRLVLDSNAFAGEQTITDWLQVDTTFASRVRKSTHADDEDEDTADQAGDQATDQPTENSSEEDDMSEEDDTASESPSGMTNLPDCKPLQTEGDNPTLDPDTRYAFCNLDNTRMLTSTQPTQWLLRNARGIHVLRVAADKGSVTLLNGAPFENRSLLQGDNALLLAAVTQLHAHDHLYLLNEPEYASLPGLVWRHAAPVVMASLLLIALLLWRHGTRFGPPLAGSVAVRRSLAEQIRGTSQFMLRLGHGSSGGTGSGSGSGSGQVLYQACLDALDQAAHRHVAHYAQLDAPQRIAQLAHATHVDADLLRLAMNHAGERPRAEWQQAITLLETVRRRLLASRTPSSTDKTF